MNIYNEKLILQTGDGTNESFTNGDEYTESTLPSNLESMAVDNEWDLAYAAKKSNEAVAFAEPNLDNKYHFKNTAFDDTLESLSTEELCKRNNGFELNWPYPKDAAKKAIHSIWHLGDDYSQLKSARDSIQNSAHIVRIAHFDTGYDPAHGVYADNLIRHDLERNFIEGEDPKKALDTSGGAAYIENPGHGTGTLSILAGKQISIPNYGFNDSIGLAKGIEIVPLRIAKSVMLFKNTSFIKALEYVISLYDNPSTRCHIVTMSMGGLASKAWADVVNKAYEKGIFIVTAAGNNLGRATPRTLIYPARFKRVVAACGVTYDYSPYFKEFDMQDIKTMQGNFGPRKLMRTAIAAFTPNVTWAKIGCGNVVSLAGAGTSSATPQVASAAALYYQKYFTELDAMPQGWMRIEAIRKALFSTAAKKINHPDKDVELYFGTGVLQARKMLDVKPDSNQLRKEEEDDVSWPLFKLLTDISFNEALMPEAMDPELKKMFETEITQLVQQSAELQALLDNEEKEVEDLTPEEEQRFKQIILSMPQASQTLKDLLSKAG
jgi:subtilisin family serine protease